MSDLLVPLTFLATIITIVSGGITILSFIRQRTPSPPLRNEMPPYTLPQAPQGLPSFPSYPTYPTPQYPPIHVPPSNPSLPQSPENTSPVAPVAAPPYVPQTPHPLAQPILATRRIVSYPLIAISGVLCQIAAVVWLVLILQGATNGQYVWGINGTIDTLSVIFFLIGFFGMVGLLIYSLVLASSLKRWGWFIGILLGTLAGFIAFSGIAITVFGLWGPYTRRGEASNTGSFSLPQYPPTQTAPMNSLTSSQPVPAMYLPVAPEIGRAVPTYPNFVTPFMPARKRRVSYPLIAAGGILAQVVGTAWLILIEIPGPAGKQLWMTNDTVNLYGSILLAVGLIAMIGLLVYCLIQVTSLKRWGWFVGTLLGTIAGIFAFSGIAIIVFGFWGPYTRHVAGNDMAKI